MSEKQTKQRQKCMYCTAYTQCDLQMADFFFFFF